MEIYYFKSANSSFIRIDERILSQNFQIESYLINTENTYMYFLALAKLFFFLLFRGRKADVYFIRFADWHTAILAFFKILYCKKLIIVVGGYDVVAIPELNYGVHVRSFRSWCVRFAFKHASYILPNHHALIENINNFAVDRPVKGGINNFVPFPKGEIRTIYNGFDVDFWSDKTPIKKNNVAITVAYITNKRNFQLKGIDKFIEVAHLLPQRNFIIVGMSETFLKKEKIQLPDNCKTYGFLEQSDLIALYKSSKVFCLFSLSEGMSNVLCESMLCKCIPVGSPVLAIPDIIGKTGYIVPDKNPQRMAKSVEEAFLSDLKMGEMARNRIIDNFSLARREKELIRLLREIMPNKE